MIEQPQDEQPKIVTFERNEILLMLGVGLYALSMVLPAVKMGEDAPGLMCFLYGFIFCFNVDPADPFRNNAAIASLFGSIANMTVPVLLLLTLAKNEWLSDITMFFVGIAAVCVLGLLLVPAIGGKNDMTHVEIFYAGYFVWIAGLLLIVIGSAWGQLRANAIAKFRLRAQRDETSVESSTP